MENYNLNLGSHFRFLVKIGEIEGWSWFLKRVNCKKWIKSRTLLARPAKRFAARWRWAKQVAQGKVHHPHDLQPFMKTFHSCGHIGRNPNCQKKRRRCSLKAKSATRLRTLLMRHVTLLCISFVSLALAQEDGSGGKAKWVCMQPHTERMRIQYNVWKHPLGEKLSVTHR